MAGYATLSRCGTCCTNCGHTATTEEWRGWRFCPSCGCEIVVGDADLRRRVFDIVDEVAFNHAKIMMGEMDDSQPPVNGEFDDYLWRKVFEIEAIYAAKEGGER